MDSYDNKMQNASISALLVSVNLGDDEVFYYQLEELKNLCAASNFEVIDTVIQNLNNIIPATYVGKGKLEEIKALAHAHQVEFIIFNDELTPSQLRNISIIIGDEIEVIDRTMVILDIFASRARTKEAFLQVEVARLKYSLTRLVGARSYLSRLAGGGSGGGGARRGIGETKLELDRRQIQAKIARSQDELKALTKARTTSRKQRIENDIPTVALVGYTNAGKSSTINALLEKYEVDKDKNLYVKDMLFATLGTQTRSIKLPNNHEFLLTDTVGFVSKLPHHLIESFKSTLEEIKEADLLIHVIDASSPFMVHQIETTKKVLNELGASEIPMLYVFNKNDLVKDQRFITHKFADALFISATDQVGFDDLVKKIDEILFPSLTTKTLLIPFTRGELFSLLKEKSEVFEVSYQNDGIRLIAKLSPHLLALCQEFII